MTLDEIVYAAAAGTEIRDSEPVETRALYWSLRAIYQNYNINGISAEYGANLKNKAIDLYRKDCKKEEHTSRMFSHTTNLWRNIEGAANEYAKDRTIEHADRFYHAVYGVGFLKRTEED